MKRGKVTALVGAQFGSEGKGVVAYKMRNEFDISVRTGAPNAGHSFVHNGQIYKMQSLPCGWPNTNCTLILGAGALVNLEILEREIQMASKVDPRIRERIYLDRNAGILEPAHHREEGGVDGAMHKRIGSTGEGVGPARRDRIMRDSANFRLAQHLAQNERDFLGINICDTVSLLSSSIKGGARVLLEGTQGAGLSLVHGEWPHVTSSDTNAAQMAADAGVPPQWVTDVILVARTFPIRVAGPSGPLTKEVTWEDMSARIGKKVVEFTTVTKKQRRIGEWDDLMFRKAVDLNAPTWVALTFMDYLSPLDVNQKRFDRLNQTAKKFVSYLERAFKVKVKMIGTGFNETEGWTCIDLRKK